MRKLAIILAGAVLAVSAIGIGTASAQTTPAPAQPDATTAAPAATTPAPMKKAKPHKVAAKKHKAKAPKKMVPKKPTGDSNTQQPAQ
jgi:hypothetical protein